MTKPLGKSFGHELIAAGLGELPIGWTPNGEFIGLDELTVEQREGLDRVIAAHKAEEVKDKRHEDAGLKEFRGWLRQASAQDIEKWVDDTDPKFVLKNIVKALAIR